LNLSNLLKKPLPYPFLEKDSDFLSTELVVSSFR